MKLRSISLEPAEAGLSRTLVLLHGYGADERDLLPLAHELDPRLRVVSLQGPIALGGPQRAWYSLQNDARGISFDPEEAREAAKLAVAAVEELARTSSRPFLLGFSQGAAMALSVALCRPQLVAGVIALSSVPPVVEPQDLAGPDLLRGLPVFAAHGQQDQLVPIQMGRAVRAELVRLGVDVAWREYEMGHMVAPEELADARAWLAARL